ncbi:MAG TPA: efflux RND transporter periplasmic adaptor subunit [Burkholderiales bacterium]|nr:efflux RND transporter periplasmic adaptor subunit [Burkholderiales bacterium]
MKRIAPWAVLALLIAAGVAAWFGNRREAGAERYVTATVERGNIEDTVSALGALQPFQYVDVGTQVTGQLKKLLVDVGARVNQGDLIAEIDPTLFVARVEEAKANIKLLQAQLSERIAQQRLAGEIHARNRQLIADQAVSEEGLQQSRAAEEQASAQVEAVRAQILEAQSRLEADEANLRYTKIFAPMSGTVVSVTARQGQTLVASQQAPVILRIADLGTMTVWAQVSEADVPKIREGMPAYFNTLGLPERRWTGAVRQVMPTPESINNVILYNVLFDTQNPDQTLKPQMSAQVYFVLARAENALLVPTAALQPAKKAKAPEDAAAQTTPAVEKKKAGAGSAKGGESRRKERAYTVKVLKGEAVEERPVTVGVSNRLMSEVLSGLAEGDSVVVGIETNGKDKSKSRDPLRTPRL